jgi:hypothetical protein
MTLIVDNPCDGPGIHVLAIGVGAYRHLRDGADPVAHDTLGLTQLSGPPRSAAAFVDWVIHRMRHPRATLCTVDLLTSSPITRDGPDGRPVTVETASMANVAAAFREWYDRCDKNSDNVALLYFCGHGVERESPFLLLDDFGASRFTLLENAIDIGDLYEAMAACAARSQYYFVDTCREIPFEFLERMSGNANRPLDRKLIGEPRTDAALLFATAGGAKSYGRRDQVTRFTTALVRALDGLGGRPDGASWVVEVGGLQTALTRMLSTSSDGTPPQRPALRSTGSAPLHVCSEPPIVPVAVSCEPPAAVGAAKVVLERIGSPAAAVPQPSAGAGGWSVEVPADCYDFFINFPPGPYQSLRERLFAWPPGLDTHVEVLMA